MFNSKSVVDSKIYIGKDKSIVLENVNGVLHITENNNRRPFIENFADSDKLLTVSQNKPIISDVAFDSKLRRLSTKNIVSDSLCLNQTSVLIEDHTIKPESSNALVISNLAIKYIKPQCDTNILFLHSENYIHLTPYGNIDIIESQVCGKSVCLMKINDMWNICSYNTEKIIEKIVTKEILVPKEIVTEKIVEKIVEKIIEKEVIVNKFEFNESSIPYAKKITYVISPALNPSLPLYERELQTIKKLNAWSCDILLLIPDGDDTSEFPTNIKTMRVEKNNQRGLLKLNQIIEYGLMNSDAIIYSNSDCVLDADYLDRAKKIKDIDLIMRNDVSGDSCQLYGIGIDGFYITRTYYETVLKNYDLSFYIGEPYWDVALFNLIRKINPNAAVDVFHMSHQKHEQTWNCDNLNHWGSYNKRLYEYFNKRYSLPPVIDIRPTLSVILVFYGDDLSRLEGLYKILAKLKMQRHMFELVIVEANKTPIFDDQRVLKNDLFKYAFVELKEDNIGLWQKEALMNIASDVATCDNLLFLDSDVYCENLFWLKNIDDVLNDKDVYLQPFKSCRGSLFDKIGFYSKIYVDSGNSAPEVGWLHNPGLCIGIRKKSFDLNQKANPFYLYGCGDNGMYYEMTSANGEEFYKTNTILSEVRRRNSPCKLESAWLDYELIHIDHGVFNVSFYRDSISTTLMTRASHMVILDDSGLVKWKRKDSVAESFVKNKYVSSDIYLACPRGRLSNKLILLMSVYQHLGKKYRICFPELSLYADDLPKLREFIREPGNKKTVISYDMLALDRIENHVVNSETFEFLTLSKSLQDQYDLIDLDFRNSIGIAIRQGDFKKFRKGEWHVKPENYLNDIDVHICDNPYIFSDEPTNINNIMNVSSEITNFQPVLDLLLLSKCEKIVRNRRSSFGWLASMIGKYNKTMKDERLVG